MLLKDKIAVVYGAGGKIGSKVAATFAREGARVFLTGRTLEKLQPVADAIVEAGGKAEVAQVDALDKAAIEKHLESVVAETGGIDLTFNAVWIRASCRAPR